MADNRNEKLYEVIKGALNGLTSYDSTIVITDTFKHNEDFFTFCVLGEERLEGKENELGRTRKAKGTCEYFIDFYKRIDLDTPEITARQVCNTWTDNIHKQIRDVSLPVIYKHYSPLVTTELEYKMEISDIDITGVVKGFNPDDGSELSNRACIGIKGEINYNLVYL